MILRNNLTLVLLLLIYFSINAQEKIWEFSSKDGENDNYISASEYNMKGGIKDKTFIFVLHEISKKRGKEFNKKSNAHCREYESRLEELNRISKEIIPDFWYMGNRVKFMTSSEVEKMSESEQAEYAYIYVSLAFYSNSTLENPFSIKGIGLKTSVTTSLNALLLPVHNVNISNEKIFSLSKETLQYMLSYGILMLQDRLQNLATSNIKNEQDLAYQKHLEKDGYPIIRKKTLCFVGSQEDFDKMDFKHKSKLIKLGDVREILMKKNKDYTLFFHASWFNYVILDAETGKILFEKQGTEMYKLLKDI